MHLSTFVFRPRTAAERATSSLVEAVRNGTHATFRGTLQSSGCLVCVVVDPLAAPVHLGAGSTWHHDETITAPACSGTATITGRLSSRGALVASRSASLVVTAS